MTTEMQRLVADLGEWYHKIDLGNGITTPGNRNQKITFDLMSPFLGDLSGRTVLDLGANACGLSIEFARRGAQVTAVERNEHYCKQAEFVIQQLSLTDRIVVEQRDLYRGIRFGRHDIVVCVGLLYHLRYPQLVLDMLAHVCTGRFFCSTQTIHGEELVLQNRAQKVRSKDAPLGGLHGWEPTERVFLDMIAWAGFREVEVISRSPHPGEGKGNFAGNALYCTAKASDRPRPLPEWVTTWKTTLPK